MKKFKHNKKGYLAKQRLSHKCYGVYDGEEFLCRIPKWIVENSSDWVEVIEKDYEILEVMGPAGGSFTPLTPAHIRDFPIHSVKRLSDNFVLSVGDKDESGAVITNFTEKDGKINVGFGSYYREFSQIAKRPILTTEDGVELFEGDECFSNYIINGTHEIKILSIKKGDESLKNIIFSTRKAAEEYRLWTCKGLSLKDINDNADISEADFADLEKLIKSRL